QDCGDVSTTPESCVAKGCCWNITTVHNEPNCFFRNEGNHTIDPICPTIPIASRQDCGDVTTTPTQCTAKGCCWEVEPAPGEPNCFFKTGGPVTVAPGPTSSPGPVDPKCDFIVAARQDCGDVTTTPDSCVAKGCCWNITTVPNEPNCYYKNEGNHTVDPVCLAIPVASRTDCGDVHTTPDSCVAKGCCWEVETMPGEPNCFFKTGGPVTGTPGPTVPGPTSSPGPVDPKCDFIVAARQDCGDVTTTPDSCVAKGCCWNITTVPNEPNCYYKNEGNHTVDPVCLAIPVASRTDCGDVHTTPDSCVAKGCCWEVETMPGEPNCFFKTGGPVTGTPGPTVPGPTSSPGPIDPKCDFTVAARQDCGDVTTTPHSCVAKGCCWNITTVPNEPNCYYKNEGNHTVDPVCLAIPVSSRTDCGDVHTTPDSCVAKGCCWEVVTIPGKPNCFFKTGGTVAPPGPTSAPHPGGKKVLVHIMPWFETKVSGGGKWGIHWSMANFNPDQMVGDKRKIASHYYPLIDLYASGDPKVIDWQLGLMKVSGISGVLIDWPGSSGLLDYGTNMRNAEAIIAGTQRAGLEFAVVYEDNNLDLAKMPDHIGQAKKDMTYLQQNYFSKPNYIKINGQPLLLDFGPQKGLQGGDWVQAFSVLSQKPLFLSLWNQMQQTGGTAGGEFAWIWSTFLDGLKSWYPRATGFKIGVAYPGFDDAYQEGGWGAGPGYKIPTSLANFQTTLDLALSYTDVVQVCTWNDYGEGTIIEPTLVATRAQNPSIGTNPISLAAPGLNGDSFVLDMATTAVAKGKLEIADRKHEQITEGWAIDQSGYKGYGLSMMTEIFCGILSGGLFGPNIKEHKTSSNPMDLSHCFIAINADCFAPGFAQRMQSLLDSCRNQTPAKDGTDVIVAGDPERQHMELCDSLGGIPYHINQIQFAVQRSCSETQY
ncbi:unnamed protein product, partial [Medioppia subpectinata]